jgi:hypothetical protein
MVRRGPEPQDMWQHRSPPRQRGGVQSLRACGSAGARLGGGAGSRALGQVAALEPSLSREAGFGTAVAFGSVWVHALPFVLA